MVFRLEQRIVLAKLVASSKNQSEDKSDMVEANTTYLWQMLHGVDTKMLYASDPASSTNISAPIWGISTSISVFFVSGNTSLPRISA